VGDAKRRAYREEERTEGREWGRGREREREFGWPS